MRVKIVSESYFFQELRKDLSSGYQYIDLSYAPQKGANPPLSLSTLTYTPVSPENTPEQEEDMSINDEKILSSTALIPEEVYQHLPAFITRALKVVSNPSRKRYVAFRNPCQPKRMYAGSQYHLRPMSLQPTSLYTHHRQFGCGKRYPFAG